MNNSKGKRECKYQGGTRGILEKTSRYKIATFRSRELALHLELHNTLNLNYRPLDMEHWSSSEIVKTGRLNIQYGQWSAKLPVILHPVN